jgi:cysteine synthase A
MIVSQSSRQFALPILIAVGSVTVFFVSRWEKRKRDAASSSQSLTAYESLIENGTPLVKLHRVSKLVGRSVYAKMESMNPGGTGKDRAAINMIRCAEKRGLLPPPDACGDLLLTPNPPSDDNKDKLESMILQAMKKSRTGGLVVEGTSGSTGIALATLCAARGHACLVVLPDDQAVEKQSILKSLGAIVYEVPTAAISNPNHYVNIARKTAKVASDTFGIQAVFIDQFENAANYQIHYQMTGPEIWKQLPSIDAFVMSSGTGGTISGVGAYLKERNSAVEIVLVDPPGSALYHKIEHGIAYAVQQSERRIRKHRYDTLAEGIGLDRVTHNFDLGLHAIDRAIRVTDQEAVDMAHWILKTEGLWVGSSSAMNLVGAIRTASDLPPASSVVTIICDAGQRHATRFWNPKFIQEWGLNWPEAECIPECLQAIVSLKKQEPII